MYYRRKIILALLEAFDSKIDKISLQKLLFLFAVKQDIPSYHFVPYKYGCFSFQANADLLTLCKYERVRNKGSDWLKIDKDQYKKLLKPNDKAVLDKIVATLFGKPAKELIQLTYKAYPYFAINSRVSNQYLTKQELANIDAARPSAHNRSLFTIGYEGISLEEYLNKLIAMDVRILCDVRKNALSMKYGFSKKQLSNACQGVGISYIHLPDVGISSKKRGNLENQKDYDLLFEDYKINTLPSTTETLAQIKELILRHDRVALTCFEADVCQCHRKPLAEALIREYPEINGIKHL